LAARAAENSKCLEALLDRHMKDDAQQQQIQRMLESQLLQQRECEAALAAALNVAKTANIKDSWVSRTINSVAKLHPIYIAVAMSATISGLVGVFVNDPTGFVAWFTFAILFIICGTAIEPS